MVFIDPLCVLYCYVGKQEEIWTVSFSLTKDQIKKLQLKYSWHFYVLDIGNSDEGCTVDCETLVPQHKNCLYYSVSEEEEIVDEGKAKICHQKIKLGHSADNKSVGNDHFPDDEEGIWNA
jgi:hypothetical protein